MKNRRTLRLWLTVQVVGLLLVTSLTIASAKISGSGSYSLGWTSAASSAFSASGGSYSLDASSGQAATGSSAAGAYRLTSGYWSGAVTPDSLIFLPMVNRP